MVIFLDTSEEHQRDPPRRKVYMRLNEASEQMHACMTAALMHACMTTCKRAAVRCWWHGADMLSSVRLSAAARALLNRSLLLSSKKRSFISGAVIVFFFLSFSCRGGLQVKCTQQASAPPNSICMQKRARGKQGSARKMYTRP